MSLLAQTVMRSVSITVVPVMRVKLALSNNIAPLIVRSSGFHCHFHPKYQLQGGGC